jgi:peptidyl-prolyl cis-trans isomerase C
MGSEGGDLGWFTADRMVPPFSEAVVALENGKFSKQPVQTQFGWHVILREESRALTPPPFDAVKEQIRPMLQRQKAQAMIENLRKNAKVEVLLPPTPPKQEETQPAATEAPVEQSAPAVEPATTEPAAAPTAEAKPAEPATTTK